MRGLIVVVLLAVVAVAVAEREKRFLWDKCGSDAECGADGCCVKLLKFCAKKRTLGQSCNFSTLHGCGCADGLTCQAKHSVGSVNVYYSCQPAPTQPSGSGDGAF